MGRKIVMITAYDFPTAKIVEEVGVDYILVGDSLGMVVLGYPDTKAVTMKDMIHHVAPVVRGAPNSFVIADMPAHTYDTPEIALKNAKQFLHIGAKGVKIEGFNSGIVNKLVANSIPVMGHIGLLPQSADHYKVQGREMVDAEKIKQDAIGLQKTGAFAVVLECIPSSLGKKISDELTIPTIGIGAGIECDGQVLVLNDVIGLSEKKLKMAKQYSNVRSVIKNAITDFKQEVLDEKFPSAEHSFK